jgi:YVTN family beta-propeller protein
MSSRRGIGLVVVLTLALLGGVFAHRAAPVTAQASPSPSPAKAQLIVLSNSSPHVSVIDPQTFEVVKTADIPDFTSWSWNDDNNYFANDELWLGLRNPDTNDVEVITLNLDSLEVTHRIPLGQDKLSLYIGKGTKEGILNVGKMGSGQVVAIDTKTYKLLNTWEVPVNGDVVCDADVSIDANGNERFVYPTRKGDTVVTIEPTTGKTVKEIKSPSGSTPLMLTTGADGTVWVQESGSNTNAVYDPDLNLLKRFPTAKGPVVNTFSPDGKYSYIGYSGDTVVSVIDTKTYDEVQRIQVGTNPSKLAVDPGGKYIFAILTKEGAVAVIDTSNWKVTKRISLGTNPTGIFFRAASE